MKKRYQVQATITCYVDVTVDVDSQDGGVQKHVAGELARMALMSKLERSDIEYTGIATHGAWPLDPHPLTDAFNQGASGIIPDAFFPPVAEPPQVIQAEVINDD